MDVELTSRTDEAYCPNGPVKWAWLADFLFMKIDGELNQYVLKMNPLKIDIT